MRGFAEMARIYGVPYLWVNHSLDLVTFLQHTSRNALATADTFGFASLAR